MHIYIDNEETSGNTFTVDYQVYLVTSNDKVLLKAFYRPHSWPQPTTRRVVGKYAERVAKALNCEVKAFDDLKDYEVTINITARSKEEAYTKLMFEGTSIELDDLEEIG